jgi:hypothetical protein
MAKSLAAQGGAVAMPSVTMPAIFGQAPEKIEGRKWPPYIAFAHPKRTDEWKKIVAKYGQSDEGDMYLHEDSVPTAIPTWKAFWLTHKQYWAKTAPNGDVLRTSFKETPDVSKEHVEAVVIVMFDDRLVPANVQFRTTKCPAAKTMSDALAEAATPEWAEKSPSHKETLICAQPFMRFYGTITLGPSRPAKSSGLPYRPTRCDVSPTGPAEWRLLKAFTEDPESQKKLEAAARTFQSRIEEVMKKVGA